MPLPRLSVTLTELVRRPVVLTVHPEPWGHLWPPGSSRKGAQRQLKLSWAWETALSAPLPSPAGGDVQQEA